MPGGESEDGVGDESGARKTSEAASESRAESGVSACGERGRGRNDLGLGFGVEDGRTSAYIRRPADALDRRALLQRPPIQRLQAVPAV